ncbi:unnamed protein product [Dicrocoelium dendriticum]|nr:unnamed protein product [Dicrocoelium dendriticum]
MGQTLEPLHNDLCLVSLRVTSIFSLLYSLLVCGGCSMTDVQKRLRKELMELLMSSPIGITAFPDGENLTRWLASIQGPDETVYEGQRYKLLLEFGSNYPYSPPTVRFVSRCYHPNVDTRGTICLDILKEKWSPLLTVENLLLSIRSLLAEPNNDSPLNGQAAQLWSNQSAFRAEMLKFQASNS